MTDSGFAPSSSSLRGSSVPHSRALAEAVAFFRELPRPRPLLVLPSVSVPREDGTQSKADLAVYSSEEPGNAPWLVLEIVEPDDRFTDVVDQLDAYHQLGVTHVWLADPFARRLFQYDADGLQAVASLLLPEANRQLTVTQIFR